MSEPEKRVKVESPVMARNREEAEKNRKALHELGLFTVNMISSPGSGKTALLEAMARELGEGLAVIEGDVQTARDAERVRAAGARAIQIETGGSCHLDARRVGEKITELDLSGVKILVIENVGNLVCPAAYDLGEDMKAAILSLPEGDDKVLKYPSLFRRVQALVINKIDLAPYLEFDVDRAVAECASLNESFETFRLSAKTGEGVDVWCRYLLEKASA